MYFQKIMVVKKKYLDDYLKRFMLDNLDINKII